MNAYFDNVQINNVRTHEIPSHSFGDGLISFICALVAMVTCPVAVMLEKTAAVFALFVAFFGVVGAIEGGTLSVFTGILACGIISLCEYAILKSFWKNGAKKNSKT